MSFFTSEAVQVWMTSPYALAILGLFSFSESAFFIIPPEVMVIPMSLATPQFSLWYGLFITLFSVLGAMFGYWLGKKGGKPILHKLFKQDHITTVQKLFQKYDSKA